MAMNVKNDEVQQLTRELTSLTGETMTGALLVAVRERLERVRSEHADDVDDRARAILALGREIAPRLSGELARADHGDVLYDERGLPA
jgi:antitoxin VapB